jgi:hypothetical protein
MQLVRLRQLLDSHRVSCPLIFAHSITIVPLIRRLFLAHLADVVAMTLSCQFEIVL